MRKPPCLVAMIVLTCGCSTWTPIRSASDIERGQMIKIERGGQTLVFSSVIPCNVAGNIIARYESNCRSGDATFDAHHDRVFVHEKRVSATAAGVFVFFGVAALGGLFALMGWLLSVKAP